MAALASAVTRHGVLLSFRGKCGSCIAGAVTTLNRRYSENAQKLEKYDVIVVGGGLVGTTLACAIANNKYLENRNVLLLEGGKKLEYTPKEKYSNRVVALNQQSCKLLKDIGAWKHIEAVRYCPVEGMQVWDACSDAVITFDSSEEHPILAYIVENDLILHAVQTQLREKKNVDVVYNAKVENVKLSKKHTEDGQISLADGQKYKAQLVVGADGANSLVRRAMGVDYIKRNYDEMGIVATLKLSEPTENFVAWQRFLPTGPIAFLPLTNSLSSLVWTVTTSEAKKLLKISEEEFVDSVNQAIWEVHPKTTLVESSTRFSNFIFQQLNLPNVGLNQLPPSISAIEEGSRAAFPLGLGFSVTNYSCGAVLVGDAVHKVHPLAGQGANLGFGDVTTLVEKLAESAKNGAHLGDAESLILYERNRLMNTIPITLGIHMLHDIYGGTWPPLVAARNVGVQFVNACSPLKRVLTRCASGETACKDRC